MSSFESTGISPGFLLPNTAFDAPYFIRFPAIQYDSPPARFDTDSPKFRRSGVAPPLPDDPTNTIANRFLATAPQPTFSAPLSPTQHAAQTRWREPRSA